MSPPSPSAAFLPNAKTRRALHREAFELLDRAQRLLFQAWARHEVAATRKTHP